MGSFWAPQRSTGPSINFQEDYDASSVSGRSAIVTGGATGIGKGCVEGLAQNGAYVIFCDINEIEGRAVEKEFVDRGLFVKFVRTDVTSWDDVVALFKAAIAFSPKQTVDIVIPNAGIAGPSLGQWLANTPLNSITQDPLPPSRRVVDVNYLAVWNTVHAATFYFKTFPGPTDDAHSKLIIFVSSMAGYTPMPTVVDYNSSKWGVRGLFWSLRNTEQLLGEGKPKFRVNLIAPSWIRTNMTARFQAVVKERKLQVKIGDVSDCVDVVLRMAADESVVGRAAAIVGDRQSFDLGDDSEGYGVGKTMMDPDSQRRLGYAGRTAAKSEVPAKSEESAAESSHVPAASSIEPSSASLEKGVASQDIGSAGDVDSVPVLSSTTTTGSAGQQPVAQAAVPLMPSTTTATPIVLAGQQSTLAPVNLTEKHGLDRDPEQLIPQIAVQ